jgi:threonine dehydratase
MRAGAWNRHASGEFHEALGERRPPSHPAVSGDHPVTNPSSIGDSSPVPPTLDDVRAAARTIAPHLPRTPLIRSWKLSERLGCDVHIKCESFQPVGAFKVRGGVNLAANLPEEERRAGLVGSSTGNHGQSLAFAGRLFGIRVVIYVPAERTNPLKVRVMEGLGAEVRRHGRDFDAAREACEAAAVEEGLRYVHSANEPLHVAGVGTVALEILEDLPDADVMIVPVGGGSGIAGDGVVTRSLRPELELIGVQSEEAPGAWTAWKEGHLNPHPRMESEHEGLATRVPFQLPMEIMRETLSDFVLVPDREIDQAIRILAEDARLVAEGAGASPLAAALRLGEPLRGRKVVMVLSGGNLPLDRMARILGEG